MLGKYHDTFRRHFDFPFKIKKRKNSIFFSAFGYDIPENLGPISMTFYWNLLKMYSLFIIKKNGIIKSLNLNLTVNFRSKIC